MRYFCVNKISEFVFLENYLLKMLLKLRHFALVFFHSHSAATGVFRYAFREIVESAISCLPKTLQKT